MTTRLAVVTEHLIDGSKKLFCWLSFEFKSPHKRHSNRDANLKMSIEGIDRYSTADAFSI